MLCCFTGLHTVSFRELPRGGFLRYQYLRVFLTETSRPPILEYAGYLGPRVTRTEFILNLFSQRIDFVHRGNPFVYMPIGEERAKDGKFLLGRMGRTVKSLENQPPETGFEEVVHTSWRAANAVFDTRDHADGQKLALQFRQDVGKPLPIANSLAAAINETYSDAGWRVSINAITETSDFWDVARKYKGEITSATFTYVVPNVLRMRSQLNDDLKRGREKHNIEKYTETLENSEGNLILEGEDVEDAVNYTAEGGGSSKLKSGKRTLFDSQTHEKFKEIEINEALTPENKSVWSVLVELIFGKNGDD